MKPPQKNWLEWTIFGFSLLLILATAGTLVQQEFSLEDNPPDPHIGLGTPESHDGYFAVPVTVTNRGDSTAASVQVEVVLRTPDGESETGQFDLPYLPRRSTREGWVTFRHDPAKGKMEPRILGYEKP